MHAVAGALVIDKSALSPSTSGSPRRAEVLCASRIVAVAPRELQKALSSSRGNGGDNQGGLAHHRAGPRPDWTKTTSMPGAQSEAARPVERAALIRSN
jgi:hypothetical protein